MHGKAIKERQIASGIVHMTEECDNWELETWQLRNEQWALKKRKKVSWQEEQGECFISFSIV